MVIPRRVFIPKKESTFTFKGFPTNPNFLATNPQDREKQSGRRSPPGFLGIAHNRVVRLVPLGWNGFANSAWMSRLEVSKKLGYKRVITEPPIYPMVPSSLQHN